MIVRSTRSRVVLKENGTGTQLIDLAYSKNKYCTTNYHVFRWDLRQGKTPETNGTRTDVEIDDSEIPHLNFGTLPIWSAIINIF